MASPSSSRNKRPVIIAGGGIGGLAAALALARKGFKSVVLEQGQKDPYETSSIIHDDRTLLELRVKQMRHPRAHARQPLARTVHQVGNVVRLGQANGELQIGSSLTVVEFRNEKQRLYGALVEHGLRPHGNTFRIARKRIDLVNSEGELDGIAILL